VFRQEETVREGAVCEGTQEKTLCVYRQEKTVSEGAVCEGTQGKTLATNNS
jgi:hypothetical protein